MKTQFYISILIFLTACGNDTNIKTQQISRDSIVSVGKPDSISYPQNLFYSVYELSAKTTAVVININETEKPTVFDSIFNQLSLTDSLGYSLFKSPKNCYYFDTIGEYKLLRSEKLEKEIKKRFYSELYIYGTKGVMKAKIKNILFGLDECRTNILAFCIDNIDTSSIGHPLLGSRQLLQLNFGGQYENIEKNIEKFLKNKKYDYTDSIKTKVFAMMDTLYFTYSDDFQWGHKPDLRKCLFPSRAIFISQKDKSLKRYWLDGLDLFGIPCD